MNRIIKFRGKNKDIGWVYGGFIHITSRHYDNEEGQIEVDEYYIITEDGVQFEVDKETIGQFTGLYDKNTKEIYEGDIVYIIPEDEKGMVKWDKETARYIVGYCSTITDFDNWYGRDLEVIGNIYDNKNLLEEE